MAELRIDCVFAQLGEQRLDKSAGEDQRGHAEADRGKRDRGATTVAEDILQREHDDKTYDCAPPAAAIRQERRTVRYQARIFRHARSAGALRMSGAVNEPALTDLENVR